VDNQALLRQHFLAAHAGRPCVDQGARSLVHFGPIIPPVEVASSSRAPPSSAAINRQDISGSYLGRNDKLLRVAMSSQIAVINRSL
jgi:hypothetical protein